MWQTNFTYDVTMQTLQKCLQYSQAHTVNDSVKQGHTYLKQTKNTLKHENFNLRITHSFYALYKKHTKNSPFTKTHRRPVSTAGRREFSTHYWATHYRLSILSCPYKVAVLPYMTPVPTRNLGFLFTLQFFILPYSRKGLDGRVPIRRSPLTATVWTRGNRLSVERD
jgi:hypothetical protein